MDFQDFDDYELTMVEAKDKGEDVGMKMDEDLDFAIALILQSDFEDETKENFVQPTTSFETKKYNQEKRNQKISKTPSSIVDQEWEVLDPIPNIHSLFLQFNSEYFWGSLAGVEVRWSPRMTLCAGVCCYEGRGGLCSVRLSQPLLKYRPRKDLVETLLHEMIHAYLFVTHNNKDHDAHGPEFLKHMNRINQQTGTRISVYHSFHDEVDLHRTHWWKCNGPCQKWSPFFGIVKRAMNRAPSPKDPWWANHQAKCGGTYVKFKEPENFGQKKAQKRKTALDTTNNKKLETSDIRSFFSNTSPVSSKDVQNNIEHNSNIHKLASPLHKGREECNNVIAGQIPKGKGISNIHTISLPKKEVPVTPFSGKGYTLGTSVAGGSSRLLNLNQRETFTSKINKDFLCPSSPKPLHNTFKTKDWKSLQTRTNLPKSSHSKVTGFNSKGHHRSGSYRSKGGTATKTTSSSGSKTVVIKKISKTETEQRPQINNIKKSVYFTGTGRIVGHSSSGNENLPAEVPTISKYNRHSRQKSLDAIFPTNPSNSERKMKKRTIVIFSDSDEDMDNVKNKKINCEKKDVQDNNMERNNYLPSASNAANSNDNEINSDFVNCPVCQSRVKSNKINDHLDNCL